MISAAECMGPLARCATWALTSGTSVTASRSALLSLGRPRQAAAACPRPRCAPSGAAAALAQFHQAFNLPMRQLPSADVDHALARLRVALLEQEVGEFVAASERGDLVGIADALADIVYVAYGTALTYGIDLDAVLHEVHRSNMSKLGSDGNPL